MSCGPRLSSFLLDTSEEEALDVSDASKYVPLGRDQTLQLCGYPIHDLSTSMLQQLPPNIVFNEYGVKVSLLSDILLECDKLGHHQKLSLLTVE